MYMCVGTTSKQTIHFKYNYMYTLLVKGCSAHVSSNFALTLYETQYS